MKISLKAARINADLSRQEVAKKMKISTYTVKNYECGVTCPSYPTLLTLCNLYGIDVKNIKESKMYNDG